MGAGTVGHVSRARNHVDDPVALGFELAQKHRNHVGGPLVGVVQQQHAFAQIDSSRRITRLSSASGVILIQSRRPEVGAENADVIGGEPSAQSFRVGEARKTEERRMKLEVLEVFRLAAGEFLSVGRLLDRDHALENVRARRRVGHETQRRLGMGIGVIRDRVALHHLAAGDLRQAFGVAADFEEGCADALLGERVQDLRRRPGGRAVVEGEDHLMVGERNRLRIGLEADLQAALRADLDAPATFRACRARISPPARRPGADEKRRQRRRRSALTG